MKHSIWPVVPLLLLTLFFCTACDADVTLQVSTNSSNPPQQQIIFAGKVTNGNGTWENGYLATVHLNDLEVGHYVSARGKLEESGHGVHDGLFKISFPNVYELTPGHEIRCRDRLPCQLRQGQSANYRYVWFGEVEVGSEIIIDVPEKQIEYRLKIFEEPFQGMETDSQSFEKIVLDPDGAPVSRVSDELGLGGLPSAMTPVSLSEAVAPRTESTFRQETAVGTAVPSWTRVLTGFQGNRWEVWELYVQGRVPGLSWQTFKEDVLRYNPHLQADGYAFYPHKSYLLPE